jgi:hypothetical protein
MLVLLSFGFILVPEVKAVDPTTQSLLNQSNFNYIGSFKLPSGTLGSTYGLAYAGIDQGTFGVTYNPSRNSLFIGGHPHEQKMIEIAIPSNISTTNTPVATNLTNLIDPLEGLLPQINPSDPNTKFIGAALVYNSKLYIGGVSYYDGAGTQTKSYFSRSLNLSVTGTVAGPAQVGSTYPGWVNRVATLIPTEWQGLFGGPALGGGGGGAIASLQSWGPSASVFDPSLIINSQSQITATNVLGYPFGNPLGDTTVGNSLWSISDNVGGMIFVPNTRSLLYFGYHGSGNYCYGPGTADPNLAGQPAGTDVWCYDPVSSSKGTHNYPYQSQVWAFDAKDLLSVKSGQKINHQVRPYAVWNLDPNLNRLQGVAYDPTNQRLYVSASMGDGEQPLIKVYQLSIPSTGIPISGDLNLDHIVNSLDYSILNSKWLTSDTNSDLNGDGLVNTLDWSIMNNNWFKTW